MSSRSGTSLSASGYNNSRDGFYHTKYYNGTIYSEENGDIDSESVKALLKDLKVYYENDDKTDFDVEFVESKDSDPILWAHKHILIARSAIFEELLTTNLPNDEKKFGLTIIASSDSNKIRIVLPDSVVNAKDLFEIILKYIYWGFIEDKEKDQKGSQKFSQKDDKKKTETLFKLASVLDLKNLRKTMAVKLVDALRDPKAKDKAYVVELLILADKYDSIYLRNVCIKFVGENKAELFKDEKWKAFIKDPDFTDLVKNIYNQVIEDE